MEVDNEQTSEASNDDSSHEVEKSSDFVEKEAAPEQKPNGYDRIDFKTATPEEIEARFNRLYGQVKGNQRDLSDYRRVAAQQSEVIMTLEQRLQELQGGMGKVVEHLETKSFSDAEASLKYQAKAARDNGDWDTYDALQEKLVEIKAQKVLKASQPKPQSTEQRLEQKRPQNASEVAYAAQNQGSFSQQDALVVDQWMRESDESGGQIRPWAYANHPDYAAAFEEARVVFSSPRFAKLTTEQKLKEVDRRMGLDNKQNSSPVLGGGLTRNQKTPRVSLTPEVEKFVLRTNYGGSKYKTDQERLDAYAKQLASVKNKGVRK